MGWKGPAFDPSRPLQERDSLEELTGLLSGRLQIGGVYPTGQYDLLGVLAALRADELDRAFTALTRHPRPRVRRHPAVGGGERRRPAARARPLRRHTPAGEAFLKVARDYADAPPLLRAA